MKTHGNNNSGTIYFQSCSIAFTVVQILAKWGPASRFVVEANRKPL